MTILYKEVTYIKKKEDGFVCNCCNKTYKLDYLNGNYIEFNEKFIIDFIAGYGSIFGDGNEIKCILCQHCLKQLLGAYLSIKQNH